MAAPVVGDKRLDVSKLEEKFGESFFGAVTKGDDTYVLLDRSVLAEAVKFLKDDEDLEYDYFVECLGADYLGWKHDRDLEERFEVIYNLYSTKHSSRLFIKVGANDGDKVPSVKEIFLGAEYPEREVWDLFGVEFEGNEQSERFLLPDDWVGHPLRKDVGLGGEDVVFDQGTEGPAIEDIQMPHAGESFEGKTGSEDVSGR